MSLADGASSNRWSAWWRTLGPARRYGPALAVVGYWAFVGALGGLRFDHGFAGVLVLGLAYGGGATQGLLRFLLPLVLTGVLYDLQRYYPTSLRGPIRIAGPYELERALFGIRTAEGLVTVNEWLQARLHPLLDLTTGFFYLVFIPHFVLTIAYFHRGPGRRGTRRCRAPVARRRASGAMWALFWMNAMGYVAHNVVPVAPPWYVERFGLEAVHPDVAPDLAGTVRFDEMLGVEYFADFYGKSVDAFGAIPSLHIAFSALAFYFALRIGALRLVSGAFLLAMCFSALYLNHHYVIDLVWGVAFALVAGVGVELVQEHRRRRRSGGLVPEDPVEPSHVGLEFGDDEEDHQLLH